jgi:phospholipid-translocating ATPase
MSFLDVDFGKLFCTFMLHSLVLTFSLDMDFILTWGFVWRVLVITAISSLPLYVIKRARRILDPPSYAKLT